MKLSEFDYKLPKELIAQRPINPRDHSRLLICRKNSDKLEHKRFYDLVDILTDNDLLFVNNSKVFNARLFAKKESGGKVEIFLLKAVDRNKNIWQCLIGGRVKEGYILSLSNNISAKILGKDSNIFLVSFNIPFADLLNSTKDFGETPLPPYIKRDNNTEDANDYQTVYAKDEKVGSSAAPTAGLHFTEKLLEELKNKGVEFLEASLHVGLGTFLPIKTDNILDHKMHSEEIEISAKTINSLIEAKNKGKRVLAVGTTSCRILESLFPLLEYDNKINKFIEYGGGDLFFSTEIFIYPGFKFGLTDGLITNFHLPKSSLLLLVSALIGRKKLLSSYEQAIKKEYRFFSYGDAMLIV